MHDYPDTLGATIKDARQRAEITVEALGEKVGKSERYIYRIENEGNKPRYGVLFNIIRELAIQPDLIFWPEKQIDESEIADLARMLYNCDARSLAIIKAIAVLCFALQQPHCRNDFRQQIFFSPGKNRLDILPFQLLGQAHEIIAKQLHEIINLDRIALKVLCGEHKTANGRNALVDGVINNIF